MGFTTQRLEFSCLSPNGVTTETPGGQNTVSQPSQANQQPQRHGAR